MHKILPQQFYQNPDIQKILVDGLSCMIYKNLKEPVFQKEGYVSAHALTVVLKGKLQVENQEGSFVEASENKMIFLPKGIYTLSYIPTSSNFEAIVFFFEDDIISDFINSLKLKCSREKQVSHCTLNYYDNIKLFTESLRSLYSNNIKPTRELTKMKLFELLHLIRASQDSECFTLALLTLKNKERKSLRVFMNDNYSKSLNIEDYAYLTGRSVSTFRRDFKAQFSTSPKQWLIDKRLEKAHALLTSSQNNKTISDIAMESGFDDIPHFIKSFRKKYYITPKQLLISARKKVLI